MTDLRAFVALELTRTRDRAPSIIAAGGDNARIVQQRWDIWEDIAAYMGATEKDDSCPPWWTQDQLDEMASEAHRAWIAARDRELASQHDSSIKFNLTRASGLLRLSLHLTTTAQTLSAANHRARQRAAAARKEMAA